MGYDIKKMTALHTIQIELPSSYNTKEGILVDLSSYFGTPLIGAWVLESCIGGLLCSVAKADFDQRKFSIRFFSPRASFVPEGKVSAPVFRGDKGDTSGTSAGIPAGEVTTPTFTGKTAQTTLDSAGTPTGKVSQAVFDGNERPTTEISAGLPIGEVSKPEFEGVELPTHCHVFTGDFPAIAFPLAPTGRVSVEHSGIPNGSVSQPTFTGEILPPHEHRVTSSGKISEQTFKADELKPHAHTFGVDGENGPISFTGRELETHVHSLVPSGLISIPTFTGETVIAGSAEEIDNGTDLKAKTGRDFITVGVMI